MVLGFWSLIFCERQRPKAGNQRPAIKSYLVLSQVVELIENKQHFAITTHVKPDGDGVGSSLGLFWLLKSLGKDAEVIVRGEIPPAYRSLPGADKIRDIEKVDKSYDAVFVIECSDLERPGIAGLENEFTVNIDHHTTSAHFGTINWIDSTASAVGERQMLPRHTKHTRTTPLFAITITPSRSRDCRARPCPRSIR